MREYKLNVAEQLNNKSTHMKGGISKMGKQSSQRQSSSDSLFTLDTSRSTKIPKNIWVCWFGCGEKPPLIQHCVDSMYHHLTPHGFHINEINESNFPLSEMDKIPYIRQAYDAKKWAFVSDVVRLLFLKKYGGISLDADVEVIRPFDDYLLNHGGFTSRESGGRLISATFATTKGSPWVDKILSYYRKHNFIYSPDNVTNTSIIHNINTSLWKSNFSLPDGRQGDLLQYDFHIYPRDYFEGIDWNTGKRDAVTKNTYTVHNYLGSWLEK